MRAALTVKGFTSVQPGAQFRSTAVFKLDTRLIIRMKTVLAEG